MSFSFIPYFEPRETLVGWYSYQRASELKKTTKDPLRIILAMCSIGICVAR